MARASTRRSPGLKSGVSKLAVYLLFIILVVGALYPLFWLLTNSFKTEFDMFASTWSLPKTWHPENYARAWNFGIAQYILNSFIVTLLSVFITVSLSVLAAFSLSRFMFWGKQLLFYIILGGLMLAPEVSLIPLFRILNALNLYNTYWAMILPNVAFGIPFTTFLIRAYMLGLPKELEEAAYIDGANPLQVLWNIIVPLSRPIIVSAGLLHAMRVWNEFMFALTFVESDRLKPLTVGVMSFVSALRTEWTSVMAGLVISALPMILLFLIAQRQFVRGLTEGGMKG